MKPGRSCGHASVTAGKPAGFLLASQALYWAEPGSSTQPVPCMPAALLCHGKAAYGASASLGTPCRVTSASATMCFPISLSSFLRPAHKLIQNARACHKGPTEGRMAGSPSWGAWSAMYRIMGSVPLEPCCTAAWYCRSPEAGPAGPLLGRKRLACSKRTCRTGQ